jgi:uncharacterized membrane protein
MPRHPAAIGHLFPLAVLLFAPMCPAAAQVGPRFTPISGLDGGPARNPDICLISGTTGYSSVRVSADGRVVLTTVYPPGEYTGFIPRSVARWTENTGTVQITPELEGLYPAVGVSADGTIVYGESWRWTASGGYEDLLPRLRNSIGQQTDLIFGASDDGSVVTGIRGIYPGSSDLYLWRLDAEEPRLLPRDPAFPDGYFYFNTLSGDGLVVGGSARRFDADDPTVAETYAGVVISGGVPRLVTGEEAQAGVTDLSFDGGVAVGYVAEGPFLRAFRWTAADGAVTLDASGAGADSAYARAASADGSVVVGDALRFGEDRTFAWIWTRDRGVIDLRDELVANAGLGDSLAGWRLLVATDVSADGRTIVGQGLNPDGCEQAFVVFLGSACPADFNTDGFVDFFDYDAFVGSFEGGNTDADLNRDGFIDFFDYDDFVLRFEAGC